MTTEHSIIELFCRVDDQMAGIAKHSQARLYHSEVVTLALLVILKGVRSQPFDLWLKRNYRYLQQSSRRFVPFGILV